MFGCTQPLIELLASLAAPLSVMGSVATATLLGGLFTTLFRTREEAGRPPEDHSHANAIAESLRSLLFEIHDAVVETSADGTIVSVNAAGERLIGKSWKNHSATELLPVYDPAGDRREHPVSTGLYRRKPVDIPANSLLQIPSGERLPIAGKAIPVLRGSGEPAGLIWILRDVSPDQESELAAKREEEAFRHAFTLHPLPMLLVDPHEGHIQQANRAACTFYGYGELEFLEKGLSDLSPSGPQSGEIQGSTGSCTERHRTADGSIRDVEVHRSSCYHAGRLYTHLTIVDHTAGVRSRDERARFQQAIEQVHEAVVITDPDGYIEYVNTAFETNSGFSRIELEGQTPRILKSGKHPPEFYRTVWKVLRMGFTWRGTFENKRKDGTHYHERTSISPVFGPDGEIVNFIGIKQDVTEELKSEAERSRMERMEALGKVATGLANDFSNALQGILLQTQNALRHISAESAARKPLSEIMHTVEDSAALCRRLLNFAGHRKPDLTTIDLGELIAQSIDSWRGELPESISLDWAKPAEHLLVRADPADLRQILLALIDNASDAYGKADGIIGLAAEDGTFDDDPDSPSILAGAGKPPTGPHAIISVTDSAGGMDPETAGHIFDPFFSSRKSGRGMGLPNVLGICESLGGCVSFETDPGEGTRMQIHLPFAPHAEPESTESGKPVAVSGTILLIDDDAKARDAIQLFLQDEACTVVCAENGSEGLELLESMDSIPSCIIVDMTMPGLDGAQVVRGVRKKHRKIPVILISGTHWEDIRDRLPEDPFLSFLQKPFTAARLISTIRELARRSGESPA